MNAQPQRSGMLLIVIVGLAAILLSLSVTFLARMRADAKESTFVIDEAQARIMLHAAMNYIQEGSRLGWHNRESPLYPGIMRETFGWVDVRGAVARLNADDTAAAGALDVGPTDQFGRRVWSPGGPWPAPDSAVRCPMHVQQRPKFAIEDRLAPNPFDPVNPRNERREYTVSYPMYEPPVKPVAANWPDFVLDGSQTEHAEARLPRPESAGMAWFRVYREPDEMHNGVTNDYPSSPEPGQSQDYFDVVDLTGHHGIFIITCGAGGSQGFRDWDEVVSTYPSVGDRPFDEMTFEQLRATERLLWYRVEWSPAVLPGNHSSNAESGDLDQDGGSETDIRIHKLFRASPDRSPDWDETAAGKESELGVARMRVGIASAEVVGYGDTPNGKALEGGSISRNPVGTIQWIMRLEREPPKW
jgi:hypothetical protein